MPFNNKFSHIPSTSTVNIKEKGRQDFPNVCSRTPPPCSGQCLCQSMEWIGVRSCLLGPINMCFVRTFAAGGGINHLASDERVLMSSNSDPSMFSATRFRLGAIYQLAAPYVLSS